MVTLHSVEATRGVSLPLVAACANQCLVGAMRLAGTRLLEPIMSLEVSVVGADSNSDAAVHNVVGDLARRRSEIRDVGSKGNSSDETKVVKALAPLAELSGLAKAIRTLTSGRGNLHMELEGYREMTSDQEKKIISRVTGVV